MNKIKRSAPVGVILIIFVAYSRRYSDEWGTRQCRGAGCAANPRERESVTGAGYRVRHYPLFVNTMGIYMQGCEFLHYVAQKYEIEKNGISLILSVTVILSSR